MHAEAAAAPLATRRSEGAWSPELVLLAASACLLLTGNRPFLAQALAGRELTDPATWTFAAALVVALLAIHVLLLGALAWGRAFKPVVALAVVVTAVAGHFIGKYGIYLDPAMLRNVLRTHAGEAGELIGWDLLPSLAPTALLPLVLLWRLPLARRAWPRALSWRAATLLGAVLALAVAVLAAFQPLASLMRNQRELRYLVTPANVVWSASAVARADVAQAAAPQARLPVGADAHLGGPFSARPRPTVVVLVVGETARAANWGLNGYARQTTPELAALPEVINFRDVTSCGTDTETSLPCMFSAIGRRDYDERRIRGSENLLHVLQRAGVGVHWRDNQSGCKGLCTGMDATTVAELAPAGACEGGRCLDEGLLADLPTWLPTLGGAHLVVLHQIGNHGPAYHRRVPASFVRFVPTCADDDLRRCSTEQIVNAYDNALLYTDHVLARLIGELRALAPRVDSAVVYVSDHGESLGEHGLFLHGMPWAIAPSVQTKVPMVMWFSDGFAAARGLDPRCLARRAALPATHDHLFHTVLGLFDVQTTAREMPLDLVQGCLHEP
ncbi:MAG: phosphoethanolamine--lipid A transferase [Rubrivivax sp.]|nr:phosphoethanolamine--lipid A transferase [Rubrivivax sp.]